MATEKRSSEYLSLSIQDPDQKLLARSIETLPILPVYSKIGLSSEGNINPHSERYVSECLDRQVLPHSYLKFYFSPMSGTFTPERGDFYCESEDERVLNEVIDAHLKGYKIGNLIFETSGENAGQGFDIFRKKLLKQIQEEEVYQLGGFEIWFTLLLENERHDARGQRGADQLVFNPGYGMYIYLGNKLRTEQVRHLSDWFQSLTSNPSN